MSGPAARGGSTTWLAGLVVAAGAAVLTAHGLIEVAVGSRVPVVFGWLYPVITDGLALVAYAATTQLTGRGQAYAWSVVVLAAGLSGLAQAAYLAGGVDQATAVLRFGVGAWPAVAAAIAAHLLYLIGRSARAAFGSVHVSGAAPAQSAVADIDRGAAESSVPHALVVRAEGVHVARAEGVQAVRGEGVQPDVDPDRSGPRGVLRTALSPRDRAFALAQLHRRRHGSLPSVRELASASQVSHGTAAGALRELRGQPPEPHLIDTESPADTDERTNS